MTDDEILAEAAFRQARRNLVTFRRIINPGLIVGWWLKSICRILENFSFEMQAGARPIYLLSAPPQHGKSTAVTDFSAWLAGTCPDIRIIYASYSERLGVRANLRLQRIFDSESFQGIFKKTRINRSSSLASPSQSQRNKEIIEFIERDGYFRNTTVMGSITGDSLDFGIIDDPHKGRREASSQSQRNRVWDWFTDDFFTRFSDKAGMLSIMTRWHVDDLAGRLIREFGSRVKVFSFAAVSEKEEGSRKEGEALFPELKSIDFLMQRKESMSAASWASLYQQTPIIVGGAVFRPEWFGGFAEVPRLRYRMIFADTAQKTAEANDYSVFGCFGKGEDGKLYALDLIRDKWEAPELERRAIAFWAKHAALDKYKYGTLRRMFVEDKASGTGLIQSIKNKNNIPIFGIQRNVDKYTRALDAQGPIEAGLVNLPDEASWLNDFLDEVEQFSSDKSHKHDDQVDVLMDAVEKMLVARDHVSEFEELAA